MAQECFPEGSPQEKIFVLLTNGFVPILEFSKPRQNFWNKISRAQFIWASLTEKLQAMPLRGCNKFLEIERLVNFTQVVMEKDFVRILHHALELCFYRGNIWVSVE